MKMLRLLVAFTAAFFIASTALAQNPGSVTNHAFLLGKGAGTTGYTSLLCTSAQLAVGQSAADPICRTITGDVSLTAAGVTALGNIPTGTTAAGSILWSNIAAPSTPASGKLSVWNDTTNKRLNDKNDAGTVGTTVVPYNIVSNQFLTGLNANGTFAGAQPAIANISGWGTGVATALGVNVGSAGAFVTFNGALGTPSSGTLTSATGLPVSTGISGLGTGVATFLAAPSSANLRAALTDEVGTGAAYFVGGALGTPASGTATNLTGLPVSGLAAQAAYTFVGNNSGSSAVPTAVDIAALTTKASPAAGDYAIISDQAASGAWKKATVSSLASAGSVASLNGQTGAVVSYFPPQGRLTLATATPVMTTTQSAKTTIYYTPYVGNMVPIYDGTNVVPTVVAEISVATTDTAKNPAAIGASKVNDWFVWNDSGTIRISHGPDWTSDTARSAGTALVMVNGILLNNASITNGPAASRGTYVGTTRSNASSQLDWIFGASASGGTAGFHGVWNAYNRVNVVSNVIDSGTVYTYTSATKRQARASAGNQITFVVGLQEDGLDAAYTQRIDTTTTLSATGTFGIGYDSTTAYNSQQAVVGTPTAATLSASPANVSKAFPTIGVHFIAAIEGSDGSNANNFNSNSLATLSFMFRM